MDREHIQARLDELLRQRDTVYLHVKQLNAEIKSLREQLGVIERNATALYVETRREHYRARDQQIFQAFKAGATPRELRDNYQLSGTRIMQIIHREQRRIARQAPR